jgi:shikimate kinase
LEGKPSKPEAVRTRLETVLRRREPLYRSAADEVVPTDDRSVEEVVEHLYRLWQTRSRERVSPRRGE